MLKSLNAFIERVLGWKLLAIGLMCLVLALSFVLWLLMRNRSVLPALAGAPSISAPARAEELQKLNNVQLIEGLTRLEHSPEVLLNRQQAERLLPIVPLLRQVLEDGGGKGVTATNLAPLARNYIENTLSAPQANYLLDIAGKGELNSKSEVVLERLPGLDKVLHQRLGIYDELRNTSNSPVRKSLNSINLINLMLGMLMLDQFPAYRITPDQAKVMVSFLPVLKSVCVRQTGVIGSANEPIVEEQIRSLLTDDQKLRVLELVQANVIGKLDVNEELLFKKIEEYMHARVEGGEVLAYSNFLLAPREKSREGPSVIPGSTSLDLQVLLRGILFQLEPNKNLRLDKEQIEALELIAPAIEQGLNNVIKGVKDLRIPELQGRVYSILNNEQLKYLVEHKLDAFKLDQATSGEDPLSKELERFLTCRHLSIAYKPNNGSSKGTSSGGDKVALANSASATGDSSDFQPAVPGAKPKPTSGYKTRVPGSRPQPTRDYKTRVPGARPQPTSNYKTPVPRSRPPVKTIYEDMPLEAMVRGMLITLEQQPSLRVTRPQLARIASHLKEYQTVLNALEKNPALRNDKVTALSRELISTLTKEQLKYLTEHDGASRVGLYPAQGESVWSRELKRFIEMKSAGKAYVPLYNDVN